MKKTSNELSQQDEVEPLANVKTSGANGNAQKNDSLVGYPASSAKKAASQYVAICALSLLTLSFGVSFGFTAILIDELKVLRTKDENFISLSQLTWISSMNYFAIPIGAVFSGSVSQLVGRRNSLILATIPYIISWLLYYYCGQQQLWPIFLASLLLGTTGGIIESPLQIYVSEISEPRYRGSMSTCVGVTMLFGVFLQMLLGSYLDWRTLALVNISFPALAIVTLILVPESPYWLASKGRFDEARKSLAWLRGWVPIDQLPQQEYQEILSTLWKKDDKPRSIKRYFKRSVLVPASLISFSFFVGSFNGTTAVLTYAMTVFRDLKSPLNDHIAATVLSALQLLATIVMMFILPFTGKRWPTLGSLAVGSVSFFVVAGYTFLCQNSNEPSWIPTLAVMIAVAASSLGIKNVPWILTGELFSTDVRSQMAGILAATCNVYAAIANKIYLHTQDLITLSGNFLFFACVNFIGLIVLYYAMPETEGLTLAEIERKYADKTEQKRMPLPNVSGEA